MLGTITSPVWFALACLSLDEPYGRIQELMFFVTLSESTVDKGKS